MDCPPPSPAMARSGAVSRAGSRSRHPLSDASSRANANTHSPRSVKSSTPLSQASSGSLPHHESVVANGALSVRNATHRPRHKHESLIVEEDEEEDKRHSQLSTASTNASSKGNKRKTHIGPWQLGANIGGGSVGTVRKVRHMVTGQVAAAKVISKSTADLSRAESMAHFGDPEKVPVGEGVPLPVGIEREVVIMKLLEHPNIVRLFDVWENRSQLYLIMEYVEGGELFDYVKEGPLEEDEAVWIFRQICAALMHTHQFRIYHRDLKPENILLSHQYDPDTGRDNPQIKLVDFGMAALQPRGTNLISPCGSVHYAAPEIFKKHYDGAKADVWSLGIIFYIMLVGTIPFAWNSISPENYFIEWYKQITSGRLEIPSYLSPEAKDLIRRMLTVNAQQRISLQHVWSHPLLKKWSVSWQETPEERTIEAWANVAQPVGNLSLRSKSDIDREILRNLRVLWHSEAEETLVRRLLNADKNLEKFFYYALLRHREEQQENFIGLPEDLAYSTSDYHHLKPVLRPSEVAPIPPSAFERTKSNFSILNDEEAKSARTNSTKPTPSERSYDPYRSSKPAMSGDKSTGYNVTVHRGASGHSRKRSASLSVKTPGSLRVEALKKQQRMSSSSGHLGLRNTPSPRPPSRRSMSRSSMASSLCHSSPNHSVLVRPSDKHKRGIDFSQNRRGSTMNTLGSKSWSTIATPQKPRGKIVAPDDSIIESSETELTPPQPLEDSAAPVVGSRRDSVFVDPQRARIRRAATHSQVIETEARKVSTELESLCEAAFNRDSVASSSVTSGGNVGSSYDTPPSSISNRGSTHSAKAALSSSVASELQKSTATRSSSAGLHETPNTYIARELQEARKKIASRYAKDEAAQTNANYREVLAQIDAFLGSSQQSASAPQTKPKQQPVESRILEHLPSITEKESLDDVAAVQKKTRQAQNFSRHIPSSSQQSDIQATVRLIDDSSPKRPAPLNIRKSSTTSSGSSSNTPYTPTPAPASKGLRQFSSHGDLRGSARVGSGMNAQRYIPLDAITEEAAAAREAAEKAAEPTFKKKRNWFQKLWDDESQKDMSAPRFFGDVPASPNGLKRTLSAGSMAPHSPKIAVPGKRPGFLSFLKRKKDTKQAERQAIARDDSSTDSFKAGADNMSTVTSYTRKPAKTLQKRPSQQQMKQRDTAGPGEQHANDLRELGVQRSWLSRFLHIKPASSIMCFDVSRGRARQELSRILRSWRMYGVQEVIVDREKNLIFGSLAANNYLRYKPMDFVIELFVVLEYGQRANLSLARFTQRKGAGSTFHKLVATLEDVLMRKGLLIEDAQRRRDMEGILRG